MHDKLLYLLLTLVLLLFIRPLFGENAVALTVFLAAFLLGTLNVISDGNRKIYFIALILGIGHLGAVVAGQQEWVDWGLLVGMIFGILFYTYIVWVLLSFLLSAQTVTADMLYGAASAYFLIGLIWALTYVLVEILVPNSFSIEHSTIPAWDEYVYFSFVTLTTLGYGDILPLKPFARNLAILEASVGVFFTTVLVARLVGLYIVQINNRIE